MNYLTIPNEFNGVSVRAVVEVPRGTQVRREVQTNAPQAFPSTKVFSTPFLCNYGFIPSTYCEDGDCLDCYVIGEPLPTRWVGIVYPKLCIDYVDKDGQDYKIITSLSPDISDAEVMEYAEAVCRVMGIEITAIQDFEFASRVIELCRI